MTLFTIVLATLLFILCCHALLVLQKRKVPDWLRHPIRASKVPRPRWMLVTGATGFIGRQWCRRLIERGDRLIVLTRDELRARALFGPHALIVTSLAHLSSGQRIDAIVNLAGAPILGALWTPRRKALLLASRLQITNDIVELIARLHAKPAVLVSMSAIGYYGVRDDEELTEADHGRPIFQSHLCQAWELAAQRATQQGVRVCRLRAGLVLGTQGGALPQLALGARMRLAAVLGAGTQWQSWIHIEDLLRLIERSIDDAAWSGPFNATAPLPVTQAEFAMTLAARFGMALKLHVPERAVRWALGEMAQLLVDGQRVLPFKARCGEFEFKYPTLRQAICALYPPGTGSRPARILYDPACPVCDMEMRRYCNAAARNGLRWLFDDVGASPDIMEQCGIDSHTARRRVYLVDAEGRIHSGVDALTIIWRALPRWHALAVLISLPGIRQLANLFYDLVLAPTIWRWGTRRRARGITGIALSHS